MKAAVGGDDHLQRIGVIGDNVVVDPLVGRSVSQLEVVQEVGAVAAQYVAGADELLRPIVRDIMRFH
jgi:hypothetical protein